MFWYMSVACSFLLLCSIPLYGYTIICLVIPQLMGTWVLSTFCAIVNNYFKPGGLLSMGSHRVGHNWSDLASSSSSMLKYSFIGHIFRCENVLISLG